MLVYAHLNKCVLPSPLQAIKDKIITIYPTLIEYLLTLLAEVKYSEAMEAGIRCIQAIKQGALPGSASEDLSCQRKIPHLSLSNTSLHVSGYQKVYTDSRPFFSFHGTLYNSDTEPPTPIEVDSMDSDEDSEIDIDILINRKRLKGAGDIYILQPAYTPYFPEVGHSLESAFQINLLVSQTTMVHISHFSSASRKSTHKSNRHYRHPLL